MKRLVRCRCPTEFRIAASVENPDSREAVSVLSILARQSAMSVEMWMFRERSSPWGRWAPGNFFVEPNTTGWSGCLRRIKLDELVCRVHGTDESSSCPPALFLSWDGARIVVEAACATICGNPWDGMWRSPATRSSRGRPTDDYIHVYIVSTLVGT